jgi:hypothetical protein
MYTKPEDSLTTKQNESLRGRFLVVWLVVTLSMLRIASWVSGQIILFLTYGRERVFREHLQIVRVKPQLVVSNGDLLLNRSFEHYLIGVVIWIPSTTLLLFLAWKLLPKPYQEVMRQQGSPAGWSILSTIILFFALNMLPLHWALLLAAVLLPVLLLTARSVISTEGRA